MKARWLTALVVGQCLYTLGAAVASGTVFRYFVADWRLPAAAMTLVLVMPETVQTLAVAAGRLVRGAATAKRAWLVWAVAGRAAATGAALVGVTDPEQTSRAVAYGMIALQAAGEAMQAVSYVALLVWLSRIVESDRWGRVLGLRRGGVVAGMLALPALLSAAGKARADGAEDLLVGNAMTFAAIAVLWLIPADAGGPVERRPRPLGERLRTLWAKPEAAGLMCSAWHLAAAQGLTQYVMFRYGIDALGVDAATKARLLALMFGLQLPLTLVAGWLLDRVSGRWVYAVGVWITAAAVPCWLLADRAGWLIWMTYGLFGAFSLVNVAGQTLSLRLTGEEDRAEAVAAVRFGAGLVAAATPLAVSPLLPEGPAAGFAEDPTSPWVIVMLASLLGRVTAPVWLWAVPAWRRGSA